MKKLKVDQMENIQGGAPSSGGGRTRGCVGAVLGIIGLVATIAAIPVTGGVSMWLYASAYGGAITTGFSIADCAGLA